MGLLVDWCPAWVCWLTGAQYGKRYCWWNSYTSSVLLENSRTIMVNQLDQHYTSSNQHKPAYTNIKFIQDYTLNISAGQTGIKHMCT